MATIRKEIRIDASPADVWSAVRDFGAVHSRLAPGFVVDTQVDGEVRTVTFGNGMVARESLVELDDQRRRLAYAIVGGRAAHYNASMLVNDDGRGGTLAVWTIDVLPHELGGPIGAMAAQGASVMQATLARKVAG
jgi:carbon monoxide dehydrogenase subunit G